MSNDRTSATVVIDSGSYSTKVGYAGDTSPRYTFPTLVGRAWGVRGRDPGPMDVWVGEEAEPRRLLHLNRPVQRGIVSNWEDIEQVNY